MNKKQVIATLKYLSFGAVICIFIIAGARFLANVSSPFPYPYLVPAIKLAEIKEAGNADLLILGGTQAAHLTPFIDQFISETSKRLKRPLKVYNWARDNEIMAVTLKKVKSLKQLPMLSLYLGGSDEFSKPRFKIRQILKVNKNILRAENDTLMTAMITVPILSRLIYTPVDKVVLGHSEKVGPLLSLPDKALKYILKLHYTLYKNEIIELFNLYKIQDATIWVVPAALDINRTPQKICDYTENQKTFDQRKKILALQKSGQLKEAKNMALNLVSSKAPNAMNYYVLGQVLLDSGEYQSARSALYHARMYDCALSYSTPIHLKILMEEAERRSFKVLDFNRMVLSQLGRNQLFFSEQQPQNIYYEQLIQKMIKEFTLFLER